MDFETPAPNLPIIDISDENLKPRSGSWFAACNDVRHALEEYGCFMAYYNQVPLELHNKIFKALGELFDLPIEIKVKNTSDKPSHGYIGQIPIYPLHESLGIDHARNPQEIQSLAKLMWPTGNEHFWYIIYNFMFLYYVNGLEVYAKDGKTSIRFEPPSPSFFMVMAGETFMAWSNGRIHPPTHRVVMRGNEARYSLTMYAFRKEIIGAPEELVDDKHPLQFKPFDH